MKPRYQLQNHTPCVSASSSPPCRQAPFWLPLHKISLEEGIVSTISERDVVSTSELHIRPLDPKADPCLVTQAKQLDKDSIKIKSVGIYKRDAKELEKDSIKIKSVGTYKRDAIVPDKDSIKIKSVGTYQGPQKRVAAIESFDRH